MLTSPKNPKVVAAARLKKRSIRDQERRFLVEGAQAVSEGLSASPDALTALFTTDPLDPIALGAARRGVEVHEVGDDAIRAITSTVTPQPLVAIAPYLDVELSALVGAAAEDGTCVAILHEVRDPGNAGTVLRSADAAGAGGVVFTASSVDVYNPKAVRSSAGSLFHLPLVRGVDTREAIETVQGAGVRVVAMAADAPHELYRADLSGPIAFVFGNEAHGLPDEIRSLADDAVRVPHVGRAESLNLAAAATVCLFEWQRRRLRRGEVLENIIAASAHDIRSPLTAMKGFGYALEKRWDVMTPEQRAVMLQGIVHDADRMDAIVRQLVDSARVMAGTMEVFPEQVDVADLVLSIAEGQRRDPDHPPIDWVGEGVTVMVDPARLKSAILALIESLVWWAHEGPVRVDATIEGDRLRVSASRSGSELGADAVEPLFIPRRPGQGAGSKIGLFVTRGIAESQGGHAWGEVTDGTLAFHLELPVGL